MIYIIITSLVYLAVAIFVGISMKKQTTFSKKECAVLGLTTAIPSVICLILDGLQILASWTLRAGFLLGGKEYTEVAESFISKQIGKNVTVIMGDESDSKEE
jgi:ABC-type proline/glycine betaine transport system permease subunit